MRAFLVFLLAVAALLALAFALGWFADAGAPGPGADIETTAPEESASPGLETADRPAEKTLTPPPATAETAVRFRLVGQVTAPSGQGIAEALVTVDLRGGGATERLGTTRTGPDGRYTFALTSVAALPRERRATRHLRAWAQASAWMPSKDQRTRTLPPSIEGDATVELSFVLSPGGVAAGRVLDAAGRPVQDAGVTLADGEGTSISWASCRLDGSYRLGVPQAGVYTVRALSQAHGRGQLGPLRLDRSSVEQLDDLTLLAEAVIAGQVLFRDGTPVSDAELWGKFLAAEEGVVPDPSLPRPPQMHGHSDETGHFRLPVFRPGSYRLSLSAAFGAKCERSVRSGEEDVRLVVPLHRILVRVMDTHGRPLPGCSYATKTWEPQHAEVFERVLRGELTADEIRDSSDSSMAGTDLSMDGIVSVFALPGSGWIFEISPEGMPSVEAVVRVPLEGNETRRDVVIGAVRPRGDLELTVLDPSGERIQEFDFELRTVLGTDLARGKHDVPRSLRGLPAGSHRIQVMPGPAANSFERWCNLTSPFFTIHAPVAIPEGGTARLTLRARRGGWIRMRIRRPPGETGMGLELDESQLHHRAEAAQEEGVWTYSGMLVYGDGARLRGTTSLRVDQSGRIGRLFEPGRHVLRLKAKGYQTAFRTVDVAPGQETKVEIPLER